jgi:hypothetical protein
LLEFASIFRLPNNYLGFVTKLEQREGYNLVDGINVGMVQGRSGLSFALEAAEGLLIFDYLIQQELKAFYARFSFCHRGPTVRGGW